MTVFALLLVTSFEDEVLASELRVFSDMKDAERVAESAKELVDTVCTKFYDVAVE